MQPFSKHVALTTVVVGGLLAVSGHLWGGANVLAATTSGKVFDVSTAPYNVQSINLPDSCKAAGAPDARPGIAQAVKDAEQSPGNTVVVPAGHYCFKSIGSTGSTQLSSGFDVRGPYPITFSGAGRDLVTITDIVPGQDMIDVNIDGVTVQDLTLDAQSCNCGQGHAFGSAANYTLLRRARALGGTTPARFTIYMAGNRQPTGFATGNTLDDVILDDQLCDDSLSWSYQENSYIHNVQEHGDHIALYVDKNVKIDGYAFTPGVQLTTCPGRVTGWGITAPSSNIEIDNFTSTGANGTGATGGGIIRGPTTAHGNLISSSITINNERVAGSAWLQVQDVQGLVINGGSFGAGAGISFRPLVQDDDIIVQNVTSLPNVAFLNSATGGIVGPAGGLGVHFRSNTYPQSLKPTLQVPFGGRTTFDVVGGGWANATGGMYSGSRTVDQDSCGVTSLIGYSGSSTPC